MSFIPVKYIRISVNIPPEHDNDMIHIAYEQKLNVEQHEFISLSCLMFDSVLGNDIIKLSFGPAYFLQLVMKTKLLFSM